MTNETVSLWDYLHKLAYGDPKARPCAHDRTLEAYDLIAPKEDTLSLARNGQVSFEGRLGRCRYNAWSGANYWEIEWQDHAAEHSPIPSHVWPPPPGPHERLNHPALDWEECRLRTPDGEYIDIRLVDNSAPDELATDKSGKTPIPEAKRGPRPKYDWEQFLRQVVLIANHPDGLPERQADLVDRMAQWCQDTWGMQPSDSMIKEKIGPIYQALAEKADNYPHGR
ncbi:MAG: hypothetical protein MI920_17280 [Kiloniellales bacterium]|nr:hypothetical protein [Kiloniellales bacterium]